VPTNKIPRSLLCSVYVLALACSPVPSPSVPSAPAPSVASSRGGFDRLATLVGDWECQTESGALIQVSYRLVSNDSILVQSFEVSGTETLTLFHLDGPHLMATHYCAQGNQPRLRLDPNSAGDHLTFAFLDATNLAAPTAAHLVQLDFVFDGADQYTEIETYEAAGKSDATTMHFHRQK
jgi:hypothetical protein